MVLSGPVGISYDPSDVVSEVVHLCSHGLGWVWLSWGPIRLWFLKWTRFCSCEVVGWDPSDFSEVDPLSVHN